MGRTFNLQRSQSSSSADDTEQDDHESDHQENVYEAAYGVGGDESEQPQGEEDDDECFKQMIFPSTQSCRTTLNSELLT